MAILVKIIIGMTVPIWGLFALFYLLGDILIQFISLLKEDK